MMWEVQRKQMIKTKWNYYVVQIFFQNECKEASYKSKLSFKDLAYNYIIVNYMGKDRVGIILAKVSEPKYECKEIIKVLEL